MDCAQKTCTCVHIIIYFHILVVRAVCCAVKLDQAQQDRGENKQDAHHTARPWAPHNSTTTALTSRATQCTVMISDSGSATPTTRDT